MLQVGNLFLFQGLWVCRTLFMVKDVERFQLTKKKAAVASEAGHLQHGLKCSESTTGIILKSSWKSQYFLHSLVPFSIFLGSAFCVM